MIIQLTILFTNSLNINWNVVISSQEGDDSHKGIVTRAISDIGNETRN